MSFRPRYGQDIRKTRKLMRSPEMQALLGEIAEQGRRYAESISPRDSGTYATAFTVEAGAADDRAEAVLRNTAPYAPQVEIRHRVLGRTVDRLEGKGG
ncbi:HK97 gp10 family phage protein [Allonocardiopsis opalescens]|uniref:HK97 gp10 family phage protein n=1 Tax=Allonocardiopsis opalescens TaxID=1144618 RepID=A0A2T0PVL7_9ACTN|nr:HK97 gp10 family phage protein [Allonocardiopsis opalescens]PRX95573.1 hypothetical protein CLV72_109182 [Allonocardiopsis opalescens]